ncbi:MAG: chemotaxis-specific protein-glutamate methyltransferase CheB, partial [Pseudomonadota bacterium]
MTSALASSGSVLKDKAQLPSSPAAQSTATHVRVMVVDDSLTVRTVFKRMIEGAPGMVVVGTASSAERAIAQLADLSVDVILLDLEMPGMGGLEALPALLKTAKGAEVLVVSSLTSDGAEHTISALSMGAADTMLKPRPGGFNEEYRGLLLEKIRALGEAEPDTEHSNSKAPEATSKLPRPGKRPHALAIGASTGGIHALNLLLRDLPESFDLPILITQHLPASFIPVFARQIEVASGRTTRIAEDGTEVQAGQIAIATGHGHMIVKKVGERLLVRTSTEPARSGCLPSVDPMLSSLAQTCDGHALAVILSGMGRDGSEGARELVELGGTVFAQDMETSAVWGMPGAVAKAGITSLVG